MVLSSRFPLPLEKGDKLRLFHQIKYLSQTFEITLVSLAEDQPTPELVEQMQSYCDDIYIFPFSRWSGYKRAISGLFKGIPANVGYFDQPKIRQQVTAIVQDVKPDMLFVQLIRMAPYLNEGWQMQKVIDYMDAFSLRSRRRKEQGGLSALFWNMETRLLERYENSVSPLFSRKFIISEVDKQQLEALGVRDIGLLRNGVDTDYFSADDTVDKCFDLLLVGNMSYHPNALAAKYLVEQIAVPLRKKYPKLKVLIAGASPTQTVRDLARDWVTVTGYVPDIRKSYDQARIFVAPIFTGSGLQNKILEALSMQLPCVTTSIVNDSIGAPEDVLKEANDAEAFQMEVSRLLESPELNRMGRSGRKFVEKHFNWGECSKPLDALKEKAIV